MQKTAFNWLFKKLHKQLKNHDSSGYQKISAPCNKPWENKTISPNNHEVHAVPVMAIGTLTQRSLKEDPIGAERRGEAQSRICQSSPSNLPAGGTQEAQRGGGRTSLGSPRPRRAAVSRASVTFVTVPFRGSYDGTAEVAATMFCSSGATTAAGGVGTGDGGCGLRDQTRGSGATPLSPDRPSTLKQTGSRAW